MTHQPQVFISVSLSELEQLIKNAVKDVMNGESVDQYAKYPERLSRKQVAEILKGYIKYPTIQLRVANGEIKRHFDKNGKGYFLKSEIIAYKNSL